MGANDDHKKEGKENTLASKSEAMKLLNTIPGPKNDIPSVIQEKGMPSNTRYPCTLSFLKLDMSNDNLSKDSPIPISPLARDLGSIEQIEVLKVPFVLKELPNGSTELDKSLRSNAQRSHP